MNILGISGSLRQASRNTALLNEALRLFGACDAHFANLHLPLYDGDLEDEVGLPPQVVALNDQIRAADGIIIATPEYNKMIPGVLKNALDWISRDKPQPLAGKPIAIVSTGGRSGGEVSQFSLRHALATFNTNLLQGSAFAVSGSGSAFDQNDQLINEAQITSLTKLMTRLKAEITQGKQL